MATTTTNYGFDVPTSSDLVKNGATAISTLGQDIDTFLFRPFTVNGTLNSAFDIWQRGTSFAYAGGNQYTADRWCFGSGALGRTVSRQSTNDTTNLPEIQYCARVQRDSGNTSTASIKLNQSFETVNSRPFSGKAVTLSFYARAGANYSSASNLLTVQLISGTGTDQNVDVTYTGQATAATASATLTTTWQRFTATGTVAATATEIAVLASYTPVGTAGANDYFEITGVQVEQGSQATPFTRNAGTIQGELAACQRYYNRIGGSATFQYFGSGFYVAATTMRVTIPFPIMRTAPTFNASAGNTFLSTNSGNPGGDVGSAIAADVLANTCAGLNLTVPSRTAGIGGALVANNSLNTFLEFSAEL